jgi:hypothetical protein
MSQQLKERPASMLRAMFAGLGSLLSVVDKVRSRPPAQAPAGPATPVVPVPATPAEPELAAAEAETGPVEPVAAPEPDAEAEVQVGVEAVAGEPEPAPEPETGAAAAPLPLANYDQLSVASLRARLRTLSVPQLTQLLDYERGHADRADLIAMFERRIAKVEAES